MGYNTDIVRGYGFKINTYELEHSDPHGILDRWWQADDVYGVNGGADGVRLLMAGDSRAPMPNQAMMLVLEDSTSAAEAYAPTQQQLASLQSVIDNLGLHVDEGPAFFQDTFVV